jgi:predicted ATP-dependent protease
MKALRAEEIGLPVYKPGNASDGDVFKLSSHQRAREALEFGLGIEDSRFNIFVLGEERSGRLSSTLKFIEAISADRQAPSDWVYLNNFHRSAEPQPFQLPVGIGYALQRDLTALVKYLGEAYREAFGSEELQKQAQSAETGPREAFARKIEEVRALAQSHGLDLLQTKDGFAVVAADAQGNPVQPADMSAEQRSAVEKHGPEISTSLAAIFRESAKDQAALHQSLDELARTVADRISAPILDGFTGTYGDHSGLAAWIVAFRADVIENYRAFLADNQEEVPPEMRPERRYAVNLLVDNRGASGAPVVVEPNPTYQNLFGHLQYRQEQHGFNTDFTMIQPGALHRANGGVLVLRADAIAKEPQVWEHLKAAMRDGKIHLEEPHRENSLPVAGAPRPAAVPLSVKIVMIGAPNWYYTFFSVDPAFENYFKIKADIDADMAADPDNLNHYSALIRELATNCKAGGIEDDAVVFLLGLASRWAAHREKLSAQFERIEDIIVEACQIGGGKRQPVTRDRVVQALANRRRRNSRTEDRMQDLIAEETVMISTEGAVIGQVNALTVRDLGDMSFGMPSRVTARASVGRLGVVNIERDVALGGPIQQKGVMVLQGFLAGRFARHFPLSFNCSVTFEQSYGGVEGDSASLAELMAILSDLSGFPLRQDLAITGSVNQLGEAQAIGGALHKIEGFYRTCRARGDFTGSQGVVVPAANERNVVLLPEIADSVATAEFHIYSVTSVDEAIELFTGVAAGEPDAEGDYPVDSVFGRVVAQLEAFDMALTERARMI